ncbi:hypothetical protein, partial [Ligilactobacillus ruminis]|uniref:hypothetical protein n=1 Tax=Ligilactobacillus ruminis TaxID=1623 RepID=UPI0019D33CD0
LNEKPNEGGPVATDFVRLFKFLMNKNHFFQEAVLLSQFSKDLSQIYRHAIFDDFHHGRRSSCIRKNGSDLQLISNHPVFQFET